MADTPSPVSEARVAIAAGVATLRARDRIFGVTAGALDIPVIKVFEFDRPRLLQGMR